MSSYYDLKIVPENGLVINFLLKRDNIKVEYQDKEGSTALHYTCKSGNGNGLHVKGNAETFEGKTQIELLLQKQQNLELKVSFYL